MDEADAFCNEPTRRDVGGFLRDASTGILDNEDFIANFGGVLGGVVDTVPSRPPDHKNVTETTLLPLTSKHFSCCYIFLPDSGIDRKRRVLGMLVLVCLYFGV